MRADQRQSERQLEGGSRSTSLVIGAGAVLVAGGLLWAPILYGAQRPEEAERGVVARIDGQEILQEELEAEAASQLDQLDLQRLQCETNTERERHEVLTSAMELVVRRRLLEMEASERGVERSEVEAEIQDAVGEITPDDIDSWWEENGERVRQPKEEVEDQIRQLLLRQQQSKVENEFFEELKTRRKVAYLLEPFRLEIAFEGHPFVGPADAQVTIVEFSDFECPYCKRVLPAIDEVKRKFGDQVRLVFRQFPLSIHANAEKAAEASLCARDQGKFWEMHDLMFEEQRKLKVADLKDKAGRLDLDQDAFDECLDTGRHAEEVKRDVREGSIAGVTGTPAMFVNGRLVSGAVPYEDIAKVINEEIDRAD